MRAVTDAVGVIEKLLLDGGVEDYEYLNKSRREVDGIDDYEEWNNLKVLYPPLFHSPFLAHPLLSMQTVFPRHGRLLSR